MRWFVLLLLALALVAAGCGGSDDESSPSDETTVEESVSEETTEDTTEESESASGDFDFADDDCQALVAAFVGVSGAFAAAASGASDDLSEQAEAFSEYADDVPDEIRADVELLASAYGQYVDVIQDAGIQPGQLPTAEQAQQLQDALQDVGGEDVTAASERLSAWTTQNCTG